jgi:DTW domain-containing protein
LPVIANRTEVLILQHRREQFHPFNTARLLRRSLSRVSYLVAHKERVAESLILKPGAALLYPGSEAKLLSTLASAPKPSQLVVVDGTWHQAKTFIRDIPALRDLPRYRLEPTEPSKYRIRLEPNDLALSTVEVVVAALRVLEPQTQGFEQLLTTFELMMDRQFAHPKSEAARRFLLSCGRTFRNIPLIFHNQPEKIVVAYGEASQGGREALQHTTHPLYWVAERLFTGERFECTIEPEARLSDELLSHLELPRDHFVDAIPLASVRVRWKSFLRPDDQIAVYHAGAARLLEQLGSARGARLILKSINFSSQRSYCTLDDLVAMHDLPSKQNGFPGRAGRRLANAKALVRHLQALVMKRPLIPDKATWSSP